MKKNIQLLFIGCCIFSMSCNTATPENYFDRAVLASNMLGGFADGQLRELASPSAKLGDNGTTVPMKRKEELDQKIKFIEEDFDKLKSLKETKETKEMLKASIAMYEYVLPVFKTEYQQLAKLYDDGAPKQSTEALTKLIHDKYYDHYHELYEKLISIGKLYAEKHSIQVNWGA